MYTYFSVILSNNKLFQLFQFRNNKLSTDINTKTPIVYFYGLLFLFLLLFSQSSSAQYVGEIKGNFAVNSQGAATYSIPIEVPPGIGGMQPKLSLVYNSQSGNGLLGVGWSLAGLSAIYRCPQTLVQDGKIHGVDFSSEDRFCLDGQRLIAVTGNYGGEGTEYRTEIDSYQKIVSYGSNPADPDYFRVWTKSGQVIEYGNSLDSRIEAQGRIEAQAWAANRIKDTVGNYIQFRYTENNSNGSYHIEGIDYAGNENTGDPASMHVTFAYDAPANVITKYMAGSKIQIDSRLFRLDVSLNGNRAKEYRLDYETSASTGYSRLRGLTECGAIECKPPYSFQWSSGQAGAFDKIDYQYDGYPSDAIGSSGDFNGDGLTDFITYKSSNFLLYGDNFLDNGRQTIHLSRGGGNFTRLNYDLGNIQDSLLHNFKHGPSGDFNGDGLTDFLSYENRLTAPGYGWLNNQNQIINLSDGNGGFTKQYYQFGNYDGGRIGLTGDFNGDGMTDFITYRANSYDTVAWVNDQNKVVHLSNGNNGFTKYPYQFGNHVNGRFGPSGDFNGDGLTDFITYQAISETDSAWAGGVNPIIHLSNGDGTFRQISFQPDASSGNLFGSTGDFNGDGLTDFITYEINNSTNQSVHLSKGDGTFYSLYFGYTNYGYGQFGPSGDFNGDGLMDVITGPHYDGVPAFSDTIYVVYLSEGDGKFTSQIYNTGPYKLDADIFGPGGDFDGDGLIDFFTAVGFSGLPYTNKYRLHLSAGNIPNKLMTITTGFGKQTTINYKPLTDSSIYTKYLDASFPALDIKVPMYIVSSYTVSNGIGGTNETRYTYEGAKANIQGRGFLGFSRIDKTHLTTGMVVTTRYNQDYAVSGLASDWPKNGLIVNEITKLSDGRIVNEVSNGWEVVGQGNGVYQLRQSQADEKKYEVEAGGANYLVSHTTAFNNRYDDYGNVEEVVLDSNDGYKTTTINTYYNDTANWYLGRLTRATVTKTTATDLISTRSSAFEYDTVTGLLNKEIIEPGKPEFELTTSYTHDAYGNRETTTVYGHAQATYSVEAQTTNQNWDYSSLVLDGTYILTTTNALGHSETKVFDARFGVPVSLTGPNGLTTRWTYDSFGRMEMETRADGNTTTHNYSFCDASCPVNAVYFVTKQNTGSAPVITWFDKMGREIRTQSTGLNSKIIYKDTQYNGRGQVSQTSQPYFSTDSGSVYWYQYQYDDLGRLFYTQNPDNTSASQNYQGLTTISTNSKGQTSTKIKNTQGQVVQMIDDMQQSTTYLYDAYGNLKQVTDAALNITSMDYDLRGRKIAMDDPDMGHWEYRYDALGNLRWQQDANGQVVAMQYDKLNRLVKRIEPEGENTWLYDIGGGKGIGKVYSEGGASGDVKYYMYDQFGRAYLTAKFIDGIGYLERTAYDVYGRVKSIWYPDGFSITNIYDVSGYLTEVQNTKSSESYWKAHYADASGRLTQQTYSNNVTTTQSYTRMGQLETILTGLGQGSELQYLSYGYDAIGNLEVRQDLNQNLTETFVYDSLNRLKEANITGLGGKTYDYDAIGNITFKSDVGTYEYNKQTGGPHAVTSIGADLYFYDFNGNQVFANYNGGGAVRYITYNSFNKPSVISANGGSTTYYYDINHQRKKKINNKNGVINTTIYFGKYYEEIHKGSGSVERKHYIAVGGATVVFAKITYADNSTQEKTRYYHHDHIGSTDVITDENGVMTDRMSFDPHGQYRGALDWSNVATIFDASITRGFTGHEMDDDVGLINMNARMYDPKLGRFLQADTVIQFPYSSQGYNRYTYVNNNPLSFTDPSGHGLGGFFEDVADTFLDVGDAVPDSVSKPIGKALTEFKPYAPMAFGAALIV